jgi:hypothetical protein
MREKAAGDGGFLFGLEMHFSNDYPSRRRRPRPPARLGID